MILQSGGSSSYPYGYDCSYSALWNSYKSGCNANIDMPDGFTFEYFGTEYNGSDSKNRVHIGRMGNLYFKADGVTQLEQSQTGWGSNWPELPYSRSTYSKSWYNRTMVGLLHKLLLLDRNLRFGLFR